MRIYGFQCTNVNFYQHWSFKQLCLEILCLVLQQIKVNNVIYCLRKLPSQHGDVSLMLRNHKSQFLNATCIITIGNIYFKFHSIVLIYCTNGCGAKIVKCLYENTFDPQTVKNI